MPYKVLGLPENASLIDVKARYLTLAKEHHPDRLMGENITDADRERHEEIFKRISCAYDDIVNGRTGTGTGRGGGGGFGFAADWMKIWEQFINDDNIQRIKDIVRDAMEMRRKAGEAGVEAEVEGAGAEADAVAHPPHTAHVTLTLEDVFKKKRKKIRVWVPVDGRSAAVSLVIECGPDIGGAKVFYGACPDGRDLMVTITIADHPVFILDRMINNVDLYHKREITLTDYISGGRWEIPYLDGTVFAYELQPFQDITLPIVFEGRGINREGSLIVMWTLSLPKNLGSLSAREIEILKIWGRGQTQTHLEKGGGDVN